MTKNDFLEKLRKALSGLPKDEIEERLNFYGEMIDDRMEEGLSEDAAVTAVGDADDIARQIIADIPLSKLAKEKIKPKRRLKVWETVLLALGSPVWLSLLIAAFAVLFSLYASLWAVVISLWAVEISLIACAVFGIVSCVPFIVCKKALTGLVLLSAGLVCGGLAIFLFFGCKTSSKGILILTKKLAFAVKKAFIKKEGV